MKTLFLVGFLLFLFSMPVHAQQVAEARDIVGGVWDAIHALQDDVLELQDQLSAFHQQFLQFKNNVIAQAQDMNASITTLYQNDTAMQNQISATNVQVQENTDSINVHSQIIDDINQSITNLNQTDDTLQSQISDNNIIFANYSTQTDTHLTALEATDTNLQNQINGIIVQPFSRAQIYEIINTNQNENTAFCNDETDILLFGYCLGSPLGEMPSQNNYLYESFLDYEFTSNPAWINLINGFYVGQPGSGAREGKLVCYGTGTCEIGTTTNFSSNGLVIEAQIYGNQNGDAHYIGITDNYGALGLSNENGYYLKATQNGANSTLSLYRLDSGTTTPITQAANIPMSIQNEYYIKAERNENGFWQMYFDNQSVGTQAYDLTHRLFLNTHIKYQGNGGDAGRFDDIRVGDLNLPQTNSAILNVQNQSLALGIQCQANGTARVLCLQIG